MKCILKENNKSGNDSVVIRRKFVPIQFNIERENQFVNASVKLPFSTAKVVGVLTTHKVTPCKDTPFPNSYYFGVSSAEMRDTSFLENSTSNFYDTAYPPDTRIEGKSGDWWYFVHPITDVSPYYLTASVGYIQLTDDPIIVEILHPGQCEPDLYQLWSKQLIFTDATTVAFFPES